MFLLIKGSKYPAGENKDRKEYYASMPWEIEQKNKKTKSKEKNLFKYIKGIIKFGLIYPNTYYVGMSNLGFQTVFHMLSRYPEIDCQRIFLPEEKDIKNIYSLEETIPLQNFNILGFSISYELDYLNIVKLLKAARIPADAKLRGETFPLLIAGGAAASANPEPIAKFIDAFVIGESELVLPQLIEAYINNAKADKITLLKKLSKINGVYIPSFYEFKYEGRKIIEIKKKFPEISSKIKKNIPKFLNFNTHSVIISPETEFADTFLLEISRGCPHPCKFCVVRQCYFPYRRRKNSLLKEAIETGSKYTQKIGLISADPGLYPELNEILDEIIKRKLKISFSSLRADSITPKMLHALKLSGQNTLTLAPEAVENKRHLLGKEIKDSSIFYALTEAEKFKIKNIRLYFMLGLPFDGDEAEEIAGFIKNIVNFNNKFLESYLNFTISLSQFIPKPNTVFERKPQVNIKNIQNTINKLKSFLNKKNIKLVYESPKISYIAGILSRGDRRTADLIELNYSKLSLNDWEKKAALLNINLEWFKEEIPDETILPWKLI